MSKLFSPSPRRAPAPPPPVKEDDKKIKAAGIKARKAARAAQGRSSTILTGLLGDPNRPTAKRKLGGS